MIVTPQLVTPCITPKTSIVEDEDVSTLSAALTLSFTGKRARGCILDEDEDDAKESTGNIDKKRKIIVKNDTIPLPKHFGTEIDAALKSKKLTLSQIIKLLTFHFLWVANLLEVTFTQFFCFWSGTCASLNSSIVVQGFLAFVDNLKRVCTSFDEKKKVRQTYLLCGHCTTVSSVMGSYITLFWIGLLL